MAFRNIAQIRLSDYQADLLIEILTPIEHDVAKQVVVALEKERQRLHRARNRGLNDLEKRVAAEMLHKALGDKK